MATRADDNWLQRRYFAWAQRHYEKMPPATRAEVERIDRWLYSRHGAGVWLVAGAGIVASAFALSAFGVPMLLAAAVSLIVWVSIPAAGLKVWLQPERFAGRRAVRIGIFLTLSIYFGAAVGFISGRVAKLGGLQPETLGPAASRAFAEVAPLLAVCAIVFATLLQMAALARRRVLKAELERALLVAERDAASRQATEARLRLLQGQIRPHFIFNTLASLQHWVDTGDARAGPLLRSLTALLRASTEAMDAQIALLRDECEAARHYLAVMQARLGARLAYEVEVAPEVAEVELPAGLVLTLVENAVEHGIEPMLQGGRITVTAAMQGDAVLLRVDDDGVGLGERFAIEDAQRRGVGLANSRERLRHRYGDRAVLELRVGRSGRGTEARLAIAPAAVGP